MHFYHNLLKLMKQFQYHFLYLNLYLDHQFFLFLSFLIVLFQYQIFQYHKNIPQKKEKTSIFCQKNGKRRLFSMRGRGRRHAAGRKTRFGVRPGRGHCPAFAASSRSFFRSFLPLPRNGIRSRGKKQSGRGTQRFGRPESRRRVPASAGSSPQSAA